MTNVYNESFNLPVWIKHYSKQLGAASCFVLDHGSDDGSTHQLPDDVSVLRFKRSLFDDGKRAAVVTDFARGLLREFDLVIYTDADELLVADPRKYENLKDFFEKDKREAYTAFGLNLVQKLDCEDAFIPDAPLLSQRRHVQFVSPMCKTSATRRPIKWTGGFHGSSAEPSFGGLYLLHTRWIDLGENLRRLSITRQVEWKRVGQVTYQKSENPAVLQKFIDFNLWDIKEGDDLLFERETEKLLAGVRVENGFFRLPPNVRPKQMFKLPEWFSEHII